MQVIAAKAVCFHEALQPSFKDYAKQIVLNAKSLATHLNKMGYTIVSGGTDNHVLLVDLRPLGVTGLEAQEALDKVAITTNKNSIPFDTEPISKTGGIRIGTPAVTTRGMKEVEMEKIAYLIDRGIKEKDNNSAIEEIKKEVIELTSKFPLPY